MITDFGGFDVAFALALQPDGKIVVAGLAPGFSLARYNPDGSLDATFGSGGKVTGTLGAGGDTVALALQPDGKIVVAGGSSFTVARYNPDGSVDANFGTGGKVTTSFGVFGATAHTVGLQPDGRILVAGVSFGVNNDFALARYNPDGSLDATFGSGGKAVSDFGGHDRAWALALQPDGKIVAAGDSLAKFIVARYSAGGSLDTSFGSGGRVTTNFGGVFEDARALAVSLQPDGKIVVAGESHVPPSTNRFALARYNPNGSLDSTFGGGGKVTTDLGGGANAVALQPDGKILVVGESFVPPSSSSFALLRYNADGSLDGTFGNGGKVSTFGAGGFDVAFALALQPDGKIVVAGESNLDFALARYEGGLSSGAPVLGLTLNKTMFVPGDMLRADVSAENPGPQTVVDMYFGVLLPPAAGPSLGCPGGDAVVFLADALARIVATCLSAAPQSFGAFARDVSLPAALPMTTVPNFLSLSWPPNAPPGIYVWFVAFTRPGTLEVIAFATVNVSFAP